MIMVPCAGLISISVPFSRNPVTSLFQEWLFWVSLAGLILGFEFLLMETRWWPFEPSSFHWWSLNIFIVVLGGLIITARLILKKRHTLLVLSNICVVLCVASTAVVSLFSLNWNLLNAFYLLSVGFLLVTSAFFVNSKNNPV